MPIWGFHYKDFLDGDTREVVTIYELDASGERNWAQVVDGNWGVHAIVRKDIFPA